MSMLWSRCCSQWRPMQKPRSSSWLMTSCASEGVQSAEHACFHAEEALLPAAGRCSQATWRGLSQQLWQTAECNSLARLHVGHLSRKPSTWCRSLVWRTTERQWLAVCVPGLLAISAEQCSLCAVCLSVRATPLCTFSCMECGDVSDAGFLLLPAATYNYRTCLALLSVVPRLYTKAVSGRGRLPCGACEWVSEWVSE